MDEQRFKLLEEKIDQIYVSVEKTRKSFRMTIIISVGLVLVPLLIFPFVLPTFLHTLNTETTLTN